MIRTWWILRIWERWWRRAWRWRSTWLSRCTWWFTSIRFSLSFVFNNLSCCHNFSNTLGSIPCTASWTFYASTIIKEWSFFTIWSFRCSNLFSLSSSLCFSLWTRTRTLIRIRVLIWILINSCHTIFISISIFVRVSSILRWCSFSLCVCL